VVRSTTSYPDGFKMAALPDSPRGSVIDGAEFAQMQKTTCAALREAIRQSPNANVEAWVDAATAPGGGSQAALNDENLKLQKSVTRSDAARLSRAAAVLLLDSVEPACRKARAHLKTVSHKDAGQSEPGVAGASAMLARLEHLQASLAALCSPKDLEQHRVTIKSEADVATIIATACNALNAATKSAVDFGIVLGQMPNAQDARGLGGQAFGMGIANPPDGWDALNDKARKACSAQARYQLTIVARAIHGAQRWCEEVHKRNGVSPREIFGADAAVRSLCTAENIMQAVAFADIRYDEAVAANEGRAKAAHVVLPPATPSLKLQSPIAGSKSAPVPRP
jgi:hypothetical protein